MKTQTTDLSDKYEALARFLDCDTGDLKEEHDTYGLSTFSLGSKEYAIGTDEEADEAVREYIKDSIWAFNAEFIVSCCGLDSSLVEMIQAFQEKRGEDANTGLSGLIHETCGMDYFAEEAVKADGRGHFLSSYDGEEAEEGSFFIYRLN